MMDKTRIDILSGFLGAGKTTLLLKLLERPPQGEKIAICENEYGEVGIDGDALQGRGLEVLEVNAGCVCCTLAGNLVTGLKLLIAQHRPHRILLEPTGLANLAEIRSILNDDSLEKVARVGTPAAVLDGGAFSRVYEPFQKYFDAQLGSASVVFLNRTETLGEEARAFIVETILKANPDARILAEPFGAEEAWQALDAPQGPAPELSAALPRAWLASFKHTAVDTGRPGSMQRLEAFAASELARGLVRAKGYVLDGAGARHRADFAGGRWTFAPEDGPGLTAMQFIGRNLPLRLVEGFFRGGE